MWPLSAVVCRRVAHTVSLSASAIEPGVSIGSTGTAGTAGAAGAAGADTGGAGGALLLAEPSLVLRAGRRGLGPLYARFLASPHFLPWLQEVRAIAAGYPFPPAPHVT